MLKKTADFVLRLFGLQRVATNPTVAQFEGAEPAPVQRVKPREAALRLQQAMGEFGGEVRPVFAAATRHELVRPEDNFPKAALPPADSDYRMAADGAMDTGRFQSMLGCTAFPGYPALAALAQLPEFRMMAENLAGQLVRKWGKAISTGNTPDDKLAQINEALDKFNVRGVIKRAFTTDQFFGRAHIFIRQKGYNDPSRYVEPLLLTPHTFPVGSLEGFTVVEPFWVTPNNYNSLDPTREDFYKPHTWFAMGNECHHTRLLTMVTRPVPDMLKAAYAFGGLSLTQIATDYVDNWLRTRQSVSDTIKQFSISGIKTDMAALLEPGGAQLMAARADVFNRTRDNRNLMMIDQATEEFFQVNTPLSGLAELQAQAQEQMGSVSHIPMIVLTGVTPTGLNASSEGELKVFYDYLAGLQHDAPLPIINHMVKLLQLHLFGEIDESVEFQFDPLWEATEHEKAEIRARDAETAQRYVDMQVVSPEQVAQKLNNDPHSGWTGLLEDADGSTDTDDTVDAIQEELRRFIDSMGAQSAEATQPQPPAGSVPEELA